MSTGTDVAAGSGGAERCDLLGEMRRIKDEGRLSYSRLAERTHYSRSSWERFLNGKQVPTRIAVEQFATAAETDPAPLLALLERAVELGEAEGRAPVGPPGTEAPADEGTAATGQDAAPVPEGHRPAAPDRHHHPAAVSRRRAAVHPAAARTAGRSRRRVTQLVACVVGGAVLGSAVTSVVIRSGSGHGHATPATVARGGSVRAATASGVPSAMVPAVRQAAARCKSDTCQLREPQAEDCHWDAVTVRQTWLRGMQIELRYSAACQAVWGRIENGSVGDTVVVRDKRSLSDQATIRWDHDTYTRMLAVSPDAPWQTVTVCGVIPSQRQHECAPSGAPSAD